MPALRLPDCGHPQALGGWGDQNSQEAGEGQECQSTAGGSASLSERQSSAQLRQDVGYRFIQPGPGAGLPGGGKAAKG